MEQGKSVQSPSPKEERAAGTACGDWDQLTILALTLLVNSLPVPCATVGIGREFTCKVKAEKKGRGGARCFKICSYFIILLWFELQYIRLFLLKSSPFCLWRQMVSDFCLPSPQPLTLQLYFLSPAGLESELVSREGEPTTTSHITCGKELPGLELWASATKTGRCGLHFWVVGAFECGVYLPGWISVWNCWKLLSPVHGARLPKPFDLGVCRSNYSKSLNS